MFTTMLSDALVSVPGAGLQSLWDSVLSNWIGPIFIAAVAIFALVFIKDRAWMKLLGFVAIAAVVGLLIFAGDDLFGGKDATVTGIANDAANQINMILPMR